MNRLTRLQLAGWILLAMPAAFIAFGCLNSIFHFVSEHAHKSSNDVGIIFVTWFGICLARNKRMYRSGAILLCGLYLLTFTALAIFGPLQPPEQRQLNLFVPIASPTIWHYALCLIIALVSFGLPLYLLLRRPHDPAFPRSHEPSPKTQIA